MSEDSISRRRAWAVTLAATFTMTVNQLDRTTLSILAPSVTKALHVSEVSYGWLASAFSVAYLVGAPLSGWWLDRVGARRGLMLSVLAWSLVAALHSAALGFVSLFAMRIALGIAESPGYAGSALAIQRILPTRDRARGFGVLFTGSSIGVMIAAPLAALLFSHFGWRVAFLLSAVVGLVWLPVWTLLTKRADIRTQLDAHHAPEQASFRWHDIARDPIVIRAMIAICASAPVSGLVIVWGAKYLVRTFDVAQKDVGHFLWLPPVLFDLASVVFGDLYARQKRTDASPRLLFAIATGFAMCTALIPFAHTAWMGTLVFALGMGGNAGMYTLVVGDLLSRTPPPRVAFTASFLPAAQSLMTLVMSPLVGLSVSTTHSYTLASVTVGVWILPGALVWLLWRVREAAPTLSVREGTETQ